MKTNIFKLKSPTTVQVYTKRSICLLIILALITPVLAQNDYYARKAQQYQKEAEYYYKRAENYRQEAEYYLKRVEHYQREVSYYKKNLI